MYKETFDHSIKDKQEKIFSETTDERRSSINSNPEEIDESGSSSDSERPIDVVSRDESGENNFSDGHINSTESISSSSSSSSESSSDDFFRMEEAFKFTNSGASTLASKSGKDYVSSGENSAKSEVDNSPPVPASTYQVPKDMSPTASPPIQVMDRSGSYENARIPSSVFERNISAMEWSIPSNESLFSIHIGQPSFSRENMFMYGEFVMPEELAKSGEFNMDNLACSVILEEIDTTRKSVDVENQQRTETSREAFNLEEERFSEDNNKITNLHQTASCKSSQSSVSSPSHRSGTNMHSVDSPLKKRPRTLCHCSDCSWVFCYSKLPTCCHTWENCNCSNCYWNRNLTQHHGHASPILTETERKDSVKEDIPQKQSSCKQESDETSHSTSCCCSCFRSKQTSEVTSSSSTTGCNWFHCFSCPSCTWKLSGTKC